MTVTPPVLDEATRAELTSACEEHVARPLRDACPDRAVWVATFGLTAAPAATGPLHVLLCDGHAQEWRAHMAGCGECQGLAWLTVEPLDRKAARR